jgi:long-chain fatty acid transport protein
LILFLIPLLSEVVCGVIVNKKERHVEFAQKPTRKILSAAILSIMSASIAHAGSFSLYGEGNGINAGNFAAGSAAEAADASTGWYNPAGLALIREQQVVGAFTGIFPKATFNGSATYTEGNNPALPGTNNPPFTQRVQNLNVSKDGLVPALHYALPLGENATFGLSVVTPFGLATDASSDFTRYSAAYTKLTTINVSPEIGGRLSENLAVGLGIDFQHAHVNFGRYLGDPALATALGLPANYYDSGSVNKGDSLGFGFHAGFLVMLNDNHTRIGFNHQGTVKHKFHGYSRLTGRMAGSFAGPTPAPYSGPPTATFISDILQSNISQFPGVSTLSVYHDASDRIALLGSVVYTSWDVFKDIVLNNVAGPGRFSPFAGPQAGNLLLQSASSTNYKNTWRFAAGANVKANDNLMVRVGGGYDETPTTNLDRDIRLPDASRWAFSIGGHYQVREDLGVDFGWTHLWINKGGTVNKTERTVGTRSQAGYPVTFTVNGKASGHAELIGIQTVWTVDKVAPVTK